MAWLAVNKDGTELMFPDKKPVRWREEWVLDESDLGDYFELYSGTIKRLIGKNLTWDDEPVEIKEDEQ